MTTSKSPSAQKIAHNWKVIDNPGSDFIDIEDEEGFDMCRIGKSYLYLKRDLEIAELIVRAVNSHEALLEEAKQVETRKTDNPDDNLEQFKRNHHNPIVSSLNARINRLENVLQSCLNVFEGWLHDADPNNDLVDGESADRDAAKLMIEKVKLALG